MKSEPKSFASLSSGLLARKGAARPAMRPQGFVQGPSLEDLGWDDMGFEPPNPAETNEPDGGHEASGEEVPTHPHNLAGLTPVGSPVHGQQAEIAGRLSAYAPEDAGDDEIDETAELYDHEADETAEPRMKAKPAPAAIVNAAPPVARQPHRPRAAPGTKGKAAFTLRLDPERHLRLRLACAVNGRSAQQLVTAALDELLAGMPELDSMAAKAKRRE